MGETTPLPRGGGGEQKTFLMLDIQDLQMVILSFKKEFMMLQSIVSWF